MMAKRESLDFTDRSMDELDAIHEAVMNAREKATINKQNELIADYMKLRAEMVKYGVESDEKLPKFRQRGWKRKTTAH